MTGPEHYQKAEALLRRAEGEEIEWAAQTAAKAQVHATLALAAATALTGVMAKSVSWDLEMDGWGRVASNEWPSG